jgi:hypothetical protein
VGAATRGPQATLGEGRPDEERCQLKRGWVSARLNTASAEVNIETLGHR